ncbi:MAG: transposase, partial [Cyclobacteriaceae bacterium]|nr:transposase [Cyclobacteriaceae bacterium]
MDYRAGSHSRYDLKVHIVWITKYRKKVLKGDVSN